MFIWILLLITSFLGAMDPSAYAAFALQPRPASPKGSSLRKSGHESRYRNDLRAWFASGGRGNLAADKCPHPDVVPLERQSQILAEVWKEFEKK